MMNRHMKNAQYYQSSGKCKLNHNEPTTRMAKIKTKQKKTIQISDKDAVKLKLSKISW